MRLEIEIPEHHYNNIMALDSVSLGRVPYKGIIMYTINAIKHGRVLEQEPQTFKWCTDCREYDQEKHCCHRWSKVIRDTVEEMKQEQEPFINKPCVSSGICERDKQKVLEKISSEIENIDLLAEYTRGDIKRMALDIIDKYTNAETEDT